MILPHTPMMGILEYVDLINDVKLYETGSVACRHSEMLYEPYCCYTKPENPCIICPDGAIAGDDYVPGYAWNSEESWTCKDKIEGAKRFESGSGACRIYDIDVAYCCPPIPVDDSAVATTTTASTLGAGTGVDNPCIICPDGTDIDASDASSEDEEEPDEIEDRPKKKGEQSICNVCFSSFEKLPLTLLTR